MSIMTPSPIRITCSASVIALLWAVPSLASAAGLALPTGGQVSAGSASVVGGADRLTINQASSRAVINWNSFTIDKGASVVFNNGSGATLNRVTGGGAATIAGNLSASGSVFLLDPAGVLISSTGKITVGGSFVASTLGLSDSAFMRGGPMQLSGTSAKSVVNLGAITSADGDILLAGADVRNAGDLTADQGEAALVAGSVIDMGDGPVGSGRYRASAGAATDHAETSGRIRAAEIALRSHAGNVFALAVGTGGLVEATGVSSADGNIALISDLGSATARGSLIATRQVETSGEVVDFAGARVVTPKWLIDPVDLTVDTKSAATLSSALAAGDVYLQTTAQGTSGPGNASTGAGDINILAPISWNTVNKLTLDAYHSINIAAPITVSGAGKVVLLANSGNVGGDYSFGLTASGFTGSLSFTGTPNSGQFLIINGQSYTLLYSMADLAGITQKPASYYALALPVDAGGQTATASIVNTTFTGQFTGLGNTISNLVIDGQKADDIGLFSQTSGALIRDVGIIGGAIVNGHYDVGPLIGKQSGGTIRNVYATASAEGGAQVGGLVGNFSGTLSDSFATGTVLAHDQGGTQVVGYAGGLVGSLDGGDISRSFASGSVTTTQGYGGGLAGWSFTTGTITDSYATGSVTGTFAVGGLVGYSTGKIVNSYATGQVNAASNMGGLLGESSGATITNSYYDSDTTGMPAGLQADGSIGLTSQTFWQGSQGTVPTGFSASVWSGGGGLYPYLTQFYPNGVQAILSGAADLSGNVIGGAQVRFYSHGSALGVASTSSGANGLIYVPLQAGTLSTGQSLGGLALGAALAPDATSNVSGVAYFDNLFPSSNVLLTGTIHADAVTALTSLTTLGGLLSAFSSTFDAPTMAYIGGCLGGKRFQIDAMTSFLVDTPINQAGPGSITTRD